MQEGVIEWKHHKVVSMQTPAISFNPQRALAHQSASIIPGMVVRRPQQTRRLSRLLLLLIAILIASQCMAQIDLKVVQPSPANGQTITYGSSFNVTLRLINKSGTAVSSSTQTVLKAYMIKGAVTDTIAPLSFTGPFGSIAPGDSLTFTVAYTYINFTANLTGARFCQKAVLQGNTDPDLSNNTACATVNLVYVPGLGGHNTDTPQYSFFQNITQQNAVPFALASSNKAQYIYVPSELKNAAGKVARSGKITKVYLRTTEVATLHNMSNVTLKLGQTSAGTFTSTAFLTGLTQVFSASAYGISTPGWIEFTLSTPFQYDSTKNLILEATGNSGFTVSATATNNSRRIQGSSTSPTGSINGSQPEFGIDFSSNVSVPNSVAKTIAICVYPNPCQGKLLVTGNEEIIALFQLYDVAGRPVYQQRVAGRTSELTLANIPDGIYSYRLTGTDSKLASGTIQLHR